MSTHDEARYDKPSTDSRPLTRREAVRALAVGGSGALLGAAGWLAAAERAGASAAQRAQGVA